jgi:hypothetical protein
MGTPLKSYPRIGKSSPATNTTFSVLPGPEYGHIIVNNFTYNKLVGTGELQFPELIIPVNILAC